MEEKETSFGGGKGNLVVYSQSWGKLDKTLSCSNTCKCTTALCSHGHPDTLPCVLEGRRHCFLGTEAAGSCSVACKVLCSLMALYRHFRVNIFVGALRAEQSTDLLCCRGLIAGMGSSELLALPTHAHICPNPSWTNKFHLPPRRKCWQWSEKAGPTSLLVQWVYNLQNTVSPSECTSASQQGGFSMGLVSRDSRQPQQQHKSPEPASTQHLSRRETPSQTSPPFLTARMETGNQGSLQGSLLFSGMTITYFSSRFLVCSCYSDIT